MMSFFASENMGVMKMVLEFDYFYGNEAEQYAFYRIPKFLITSPHFKKGV